MTCCPFSISSITSSSSFSSDDPPRSVGRPAVIEGGKTLAINQRGISAKQILSFFVLSALLSLLDAASQEHRRTYFLLFTFVFKYSLRKALVKAHAFYGHVSLETLV